MSDLMQWFYSYYIRPYVESQPKNDGEILQFSLLLNELLEDQKRSLDVVAAFYAVHGFRLGLKTGMTLEEELGE